MLEKLFSKALSLNISGTEISFNTLAEFEFALGGRTNVPASKMTDLILLSPGALKHEAKSIKSVEKRFVDILSRSIEQPGEIGKLVRDVDIQVFSNDYEWRNIFKALNQRDEEYDELRRVAVVKYMQYLRSRQDVIKQTYKVKLKESKKGAEEDSGDSNEVGESTSPMEDTKDFLKETNIFDSISIETPLDLSEASFTRLPKGEAIHIKPYEGVDFDMKLSKHHFIFRNGESMEIVDEHGEAHQLNAGKNIVGRDSVCNVVVDNSLRDVSRMHLIIEPLDDGMIRFTDLSSHGTFLPSGLVPSVED
ncbi:MAG: FHA domain-containing protein [Gammaproteobacteria bacterium]|nr:FHA domain-containing protein [Gammaproteobacteria bacterium]